MQVIKSTFFTLLLLCSIFCPAACLAENGQGVVIRFQLPLDDKLPKTYRVSLAIVDSKNPDWIISQFACGKVKTVTAENRGVFTETWDGLDDNYMPVAPGSYSVKGIFMPADKSEIDNEYHSVTPRFVCGASSWLAETKAEPFGGDPVNNPLTDISVAENGIAVFYYGYMEGFNNPLFDLNKATSYQQFVKSFAAGGAGGGTATATDGFSVWSFSCLGGGNIFVYRADGKPFGNANSRIATARNQVYVPDGWVTALAALHEKSDKMSYVYVAQRGKLVKDKTDFLAESKSEFVDKITVHQGLGGKILDETKLSKPCGLAVRDNKLYALHTDDDGKVFTVSYINLSHGLPTGRWQRLISLPNTVAPEGLTVDSQQRIYVSDSRSNKVLQFDRKGRLIHSFGRLSRQIPGSFDPQSFIHPTKLAAWKDKQGKDRLLVLENGGPNRITEWTADGKLIREFLTLQTRANTGWVVDPDHPEHAYILGQEGWLTRFNIDYKKKQWSIDAVWPEIGTDPKAAGLEKPIVIRTNGHTYLAGAGGARQNNAFNIYRLDKSGQWKFSAAFIRVNPQNPKYYFFHDSNGNGSIQSDELTRTNPPAGIFAYHNQNWDQNLSFLAVNIYGRDVWKLSPGGFDSYGNPIFKSWQKLFSDPIFENKASGKADAICGSNELDDKFSSDWAQVDGSADTGFYVQARGGKNFNANLGAQYKISFYAPDKSGGYKLKWRTGRSALNRVAEQGQIYGAMRIQEPINGLISVIDQTRAGVLLYTSDGLYVDTLFADERLSPEKAGLYKLQGEFFAGKCFLNKTDGKIYLAMGKDTPLLFEARGWSSKENPVRTILNIQKTVVIKASEIAPAPELALALRRGPRKANSLYVFPALGSPALNGSLQGWENCQPIIFSAHDTQSVELRALYDPDHIYLRWHARPGRKVMISPNSAPERIADPDNAADTMSFYIQGDADAKPALGQDGRHGDVRFVFALRRNQENKIEPICVAFYPNWDGPANPQIYQTPAGEAKFANVKVIANCCTYSIDKADENGFVLIAVIPKSSIPSLKRPLSGLNTMLDFSANFGGRNKFWWSNTDGSANTETYDQPSELRFCPGAWSAAHFQELDQGITIKNWLVCGPFGGPGFEQGSKDPQEPNLKKSVQKLSDEARYPPDSGIVDKQAIFSGPLLKGYWPESKELRWHEKSVALDELDSRIRLGPAGQVWYGATWIFSPTPANLTADFLSYQQTFLRWFLNGELILSGEAKNDKQRSAESNSKQFRQSKSITLKEGWNQIFFRGYCTGYPPLRAGLVLKGNPDLLWKVKLSSSPP